MHNLFPRCFLSIIILIAVLGGCASNNQIAHIVDDNLFADNQFAKPDNLLQPSNIFTLTAQQQDWLDRLIVNDRKKSVTEQIINKVLKRDYASFDYDNSYTRTATQTLAMGQGNCLSMVIMTAAIAKHFDIEFKVQDIKNAPMWDRDGGLYLINGHVNIQLKNDRGVSDGNTFEFFRAPYITLDFLNLATRRHLSKRVISERRLKAMYYVNLAADAMVVQHWDNAYWLLRQALEVEPGYSTAWNSLGVLYRRNDLLDLAEGAYKQAMVLNENNINVVTNYALLLERQGRYQELFDYQRQVDLAQLKNPYRYFDKADLAYSQQDYSRALSLYRKAVKLSPVVDAFYFGLYRTYLAMGNKDNAVKNLKIAHQRSADYKDRKRYNAKLALLRHTK